MHRYIAFVWNHQCEERTSLAKMLDRRLKSISPEWQSVLSTQGLHVFQIGEKARGSRAYVLQQNAGVVLGTIFKRRDTVDCSGVGSDIHEVAFNTRETNRTQETEGRHLIERYWGRYVALLRDDKGGHIRILRDPTGAMPCLLTSYQGLKIICSHVEDCASLGLISSTINWEHVAAYLRFYRHVSNQTGLDAVTQVQAGECITIGPNGTTAEFYWYPDRFCDIRVVENRQDAMRELRAVIRQCVTTWANSYDRILHELSGGLDSAVVLSCLAGTSNAAKVVCENYFTEHREGDERIFAQKAANRAGVELVERGLRSTDESLERMLDTRKLATPTMATLTPEYQLATEQMVKSRGIDVVFSGQGGDHFFQSVKTRLIAAEYASRHGLQPELFGVIADTSRFTKRPIWSVMVAAIKYGILRQHKDPYDRVLSTPPLVSEAVWKSLDLNSVRHIWVDRAERLPCAKRHQIFEIIDTQHFAYLRAPGAERVHPLISQPIIELCLQIPTYVLTYGGIDRALVRDAFSGMVPPEITGRTVKGATSSYVNGMLVGNLPSLREHLLEGLLVSEGILDRKKTEAALTEAGLIREPKLLFPVYHAMMAETWLRSWVSDSQRAAA